MPDINLSNARELCTAPEWQLVAASSPRAIGKLTDAQLRTKIARARAFRDKWQDMFTRQRREAQRERKARPVAASERSRKKRELFGKVLVRFEAQLRKGGAESPRAGSSNRRPGKAGSREQRNRQHRRKRTQARKQLAKQLNAWESEGGAIAPRATGDATGATRPGTSKTRPVAGQEKRHPRSAATGGKKTAGKPPRKGLQTPAWRAAGKGRHQPVTKRERIVASGPSMRIRGHALARGQRVQARRDRRR